MVSNAFFMQKRVSGAGCVLELELGDVVQRVQSATTCECRVWVLERVQGHVLSLGRRRSGEGRLISTDATLSYSHIGSGRSFEAFLVCEPRKLEAILAQACASTHLRHPEDLALGLHHLGNLGVCVHGAHPQAHAHGSLGLLRHLRVANNC